MVAIEIQTNKDTKIFTTTDNSNLKRFHQTPILCKKYYNGLKAECKYLYGVMHNRLSISFKNNWVDKETKEVYFNYTTESLAEETGWSQSKIIRLKKELVKFGLLKEVEVPGRANRMYLGIPKEESEEVSEVEEETNQTIEEEFFSVEEVEIASETAISTEKHMDLAEWYEGVQNKMGVSQNDGGPHSKCMTNNTKDNKTKYNILDNCSRQSESDSDESSIAQTRSSYKSKYIPSQLRPPKS